MKKAVVFLIDDDVDLLASATDWIEMNGFEVAAFSNAIDAIRQLDNVVPDVLVSDIRMPSVDGMTLLATVRKSHPAVPVVLLTGHGEVQLAVKAMKAGAEDFLEKPYDADHLIAVLEKAVKRHALSAEIGRLQKVVRRVSNDTEEIIGSHPSMIRLREQVRTIAALDVDVLVRTSAGDFSAEWEARLSRIREQLDPRTRTIGVVVAVDKPYEKIIPGKRPPLVQGMFCEVEFRGKNRAGQVVIPRSALHGRHVYVLNKKNRLTQKDVVVSFPQSNFVVIGKRLEKGERVVVSDPSPAIEGMRVKPVLDDELLKQLLAEAAGVGDLR